MSRGKLLVHKNSRGVWFKDLTTFNLGNLGKQGWRIHSTSDSPVSCIFKARYFLHTNFLASSYGIIQATCDISNAKFLVRAGTRWCITAGANILVLDEPWLVDEGCIATSRINLSFLQGGTSH
jgi:hypothetical protein